MTARSTFEAVNANSATPGSAAATLVASNQTAALVCEETINVLGAAPNGGTSLAFGVSAANDAKIRTANATYQISKQNNEATRQATVQVAKDVLRNAGDVGPT